MGSQKPKPPNISNMVVDSFKDHGWWLSRVDKTPILHISEYTWLDNGLWCGLTNSVGKVNKVVELASTNDENICEVFLRGANKDEPSSYILKTKNIVRYEDYSGMRFTGLAKYSKWWESIGINQQELRERLVISVTSMSKLEIEKLRIYMEDYERQMHGMGSSSDETALVAVDDAIMYGLSFFSARDASGSTQLLSTPSSVGSKSKKRKERRTSRLSQTQGGAQVGRENEGLTEYDFVETIEPSMQSRGNTNQLLSAGSSLQKSVKDDELILPSQSEIDSGFVFGKDFSFRVNVANVQPARNILTNQHMLNIANAESVYKRLRENQFPEANMMTLRPMQYVLPSDDFRASSEPYIFKKGESKSDFLRCLDSIPSNTPQEKREKFLPLVTWELVDGQHILHACQVLAEKDRALGVLSDDEFQRLFVKRPALVVVYNEELNYLVASYKKNDENTMRKYHSTVGETLEKIRMVWKEFGSPNPYNNEDMEKRRLFLQCLPSITSSRLDITDNKLSVQKMNVFFRDFISMATVNDDCWMALKAMYIANDHGLTYFSEKDKIQELQGIKAKHKKSKTYERKRMAITWLRPLQGTTTNDFIVLCQGATVTAAGVDQKIYFGPKSSDPIPNTLNAWAEKSKLRAGVQNAMRWLDTEAAGGIHDKKNWLDREITQYGDKKTLDFLGRDVTNEFKKNWMHIKDLTSFETMAKYKTLIPFKIQNHVKLILEGKLGLFANGKEIFLDDDGVWLMEFDYDEGQRGAGLNTKVKVGGSIFDEGHGTFVRPAIWTFDCRRGPNGHFWTEVEYKSIIHKILTWMGNVERWNAIFMLPAGENAELVISALGLSNSPGWHIITGIYAFAPQSQAHGQTINDGGKVIAKYTPLGPIVFVMHHPPTTSIVDNLAKEVHDLDSTFLEPLHGWDMCTKYRDARCPAVVDEIISSYFRSDSWMIIGAGISHMIHALAGKTSHLVLFESDENMTLWLRKWKDEMVDKIPPGDGDEPLWKDMEMDSSSDQINEDIESSDEDCAPSPKKIRSQSRNTTNLQGASTG